MKLVSINCIKLFLLSWPFSLQSKSNGIYKTKQDSICHQMIARTSKGKNSYDSLWTKFDNSGHSGLLLTTTCHIHMAQTCKPRPKSLYRSRVGSCLQ